MNKKDLKEKLKELKIPNQWYFFQEEYGNDDQKVVLENAGDKWLVFYSERGVKHELSEFLTEEDACEEMLNRLSEQLDFMKKHSKF